MVFWVEKPSLREASCCKFDVVKGGAGNLRRSPFLMADTLKMLGQGMKVGVEISLMAMDNGAVPYGEEIIAIGGCGHGADYATTLIPGHSHNLFETKVIDILCKPRIS